MDNDITPPARGQPIRASWAMALTDTVNRHTGELAGRTAAAPANLRGTVEAPFPWMVVGGTDDGDAKLTVYVPQGALVVADEEISADDIDGISEVDGVSGRYTVDDLGDIATTAAAAQPLYLVVWRDDTQTNPETGATVTLDPSTISGTVLIQATIALVWASTTEGSDPTTYGAVAEQIVRSAVHVGRGSGGGGGGSGGSTSGFTGSKDVIYAFDGPRSDGKLYAKTKTWTYQNGLLQSISTQDGAEIVVAETVDHQGL